MCLLTNSGFVCCRCESSGTLQCSAFIRSFWVQERQKGGKKDRKNKRSRWKKKWREGEGEKRPRKGQEKRPEKKIGNERVKRKGQKKN